ncbi:MAG: dephospho-CoA kinase [bacterium]|nr:dephospho-CoA kinase [bacterium]
MTHAHRTLHVGLTGGIASGKSTVGGILAAQGALIVDADRLTHEVLEPGGAAFDAVLARFGEQILGDRGAIERAKLAEIVFADPASRRALEEIVHPVVRAESRRRMNEHDGVAVFDAALLVETRSYRDFERLIVVRCSHETQLRRILQRDGIGVDEAGARIASQAPTEDKVAVADYVIDTDGTLDETRRQSETVYRELLALHAGDF